MLKKKRPWKSKKERFEEFLRPHHRLGYDHAAIGVCTFNRGAYSIAEGEFRKAVWLNPFEPKFKIHLAWCLYKLNNVNEAKEWALKTVAQNSENKEALELLKIIEKQSEGIEDSQ
ncbi:MAG: hypothetical protein ABII64_06965 [Elusimicrobiota bacterium]